MASRRRQGLAAAVCGAVLGLAALAGGLPAIAGVPTHSLKPTDVHLAIPGAANSGVSLAAAGSQVAVTWAATRDGATDVYAAFGRDGGVSFGPAVRVNDIAGDARVTGEQGPRLAFGLGVESVWISRQGAKSLVRMAKMLAGKDSFGPARTVHADDLSGARGWPSLAVDPDGAVHIAWLDGRDAHRGDAGGGHSMRQDLYQAVWRTDGSHQETRVASDVCFCCKTAVASAIDGTIYVAWRHIYPTNLRDIAVARSSDGGKSFGPPVRVSADGWQIAGCPDDGPSIAVDASGALHVAWPTMVEGDKPGKGVFYSYSSDGGRTFAPRVRVDGGTGSANHPQLAVSGNRVGIVWDGGTPRRAYLREVGWEPKLGSGYPRPGATVTLSDADRSATYPAVTASTSSLVAAWTETDDNASEIRVRRVPKD